MHKADFTIEPRLEQLNRLLEQVHFRPSPWLEAEIHTALVRGHSKPAPLHRSVAALLGLMGAAAFLGLIVYTLWYVILHLSN